MIKISLGALLLLISFQASAHCPGSYKPEKVCLMLDQNVIFVYDEKKEHNGPYKDLVASTLESVKSEGVEVKFSKVARGVYRIEYAKPLNTVDLVMSQTKGAVKTKIKLNRE